MNFQQTEKKLHDHVELAILKFILKMLCNSY